MENIKHNLKKIIRECLDEMFCEEYIEEMAYPESFNFEEFKKIKSFAGKQKYAKQHLLGKVGAGTSRAVFRVDDEKVIKIALNEKGLAQNSAESEGYKQNYDAIARVFDVDQDDMWIEMEMAKRVSPKRFKELTGFNVEDLTAWLPSIRGIGGYGKVKDLSEFEFAEDLREFVEDYYYPVPGDFVKINTYGEVLRNGVPKIVVVDFGYDNNTAETYKKSYKKAYTWK